jgi:hypothetical protein
MSDVKGFEFSAFEKDCFSPLAECGMVCFSSFSFPFLFFHFGSYLFYNPFRQTYFCMLYTLKKEIP